MQAAFGMVHITLQSAQINNEHLCKWSISKIIQDNQASISLTEILTATLENLKL